MSLSEQRELPRPYLVAWRIVAGLLEELDAQTKADVKKDLELKKRLGGKR